MSYINLSPEERKMLIASILQSDMQYLDKLLQRKVLLLREFKLLEGSILKKKVEIEGLQKQFWIIDTWG